jgi:hypothetical protein
VRKEETRRYTREEPINVHLSLSSRGELNVDESSVVLQPLLCIVSDDQWHGSSPSASPAFC